MENTFTDTKAESTPEYKELFNITLANELTKNTPQIIAVLDEEENKEPLNVLKPELESGNKIFVENENKLLRANILTRTNERSGFVDMSTDDNPTTLKISKETYDKLLNLVVDIDSSIANVHTKIRNAK
jgi:hypothetical protein